MRRCARTRQRSPCSVLLCTVALLALELVFQPHGVAQPDAAPAPYQETIRAAVAEFEAHNYPESHALFLEAHRLYPNARTLRGIGLTEFELRRYTRSVRSLEQALASRVRPLQDRVRAETEQVLRRARGFIAEIELAVEPADVEVSVDGENVSHAERTPLRLDVGTHVVEVRAANHEPQQRKFTVDGGERERWVIALRPRSLAAEQPLSSATPRAEPPADTAPSKGSLGTVKWVALGGTIAAVALTGVAVLMRERFARAHRDCDPNNSVCAPQREAGERWRKVAIGAGAGAALLLGTTIATFVVDNKRRGAAKVERALRTCAMAPGPELACAVTF